MLLVHYIIPLWQGGYAITGFCLFVCLQNFEKKQQLQHRFTSNFHGKVGLGLTQNWFNFGNDLQPILHWWCVNYCTHTQWLRGVGLWGEGPIPPIIFLMSAIIKIILWKLLGSMQSFGSSSKSNHLGSCAIVDISWKFHQNLSITFRVILQTESQIDATNDLGRCSNNGN